MAENGGGAGKSSRSGTGKGAVSTEQEIGIRSLSQEDPLEKGMATRPSVLTWEIPWTEEPGGLESMGSQRLRYD